MFVLRVSQRDCHSRLRDHQSQRKTFRFFFQSTELSAFIIGGFTHWLYMFIYSCSHSVPIDSAVLHINPFEFERVVDFGSPPISVISVRFDPSWTV